MKQPTSIQINIPQPCHEDWEQMTPQDKGRFCDSCQKCVVDFTVFSDEELYQYIIKHQRERICGHVRSSQLNRKISLPPQPHSQLYKWIIAAGLALVFVATPESKSFAQAPYNIAESFHATDNTDSPENMNDKRVISGIVSDEIGEVVTGAIVKLLLNGKLVGGTITDFDGNFKISVADSIDLKSAELTVGLVGFKGRKIAFENIQDVCKINVVMEFSSFMGLIEEVIIEYKVPLMDPFEGGSSKTFTSEEIERGAY